MADRAFDVPPLTVDAATLRLLARGEHIAMTTCNECLGLDLRGDSQERSGTRIWRSSAHTPRRSFAY